MDSKYQQSFSAYAANSNDILKYIAVEIVQDCRKLNKTVDYNVALLAIQLFTSQNNCEVASLFDRKEILLLKQKCVRIFSGRNCVQSDTGNWGKKQLQ